MRIFPDYRLGIFTPESKKRGGRPPPFFVIREANGSERCAYSDCDFARPNRVLSVVLSATGLVERQCKGANVAFFGRLCLADAATGHLPAQEQGGQQRESPEHDFDQNRNADAEAHGEQEDRRLGMNAGVRQQDTASAGPESVKQVDPVGIAAQSDQEPVFPFERQQESRGDDADGQMQEPCAEHMRIAR